MDPQIAIALLSAIMTNQSNRQLSAEQRDWSESMQDKQNVYNTPAAQVQRLREAGINPGALSMGNGMQVSGNTSAPVNQYQVPQMIDPLSLASNSLLSMMSADKARAEAQTEDDTREVKVANLREQLQKFKEEISMLQLDQKAQQIANEWADVMNEVAVAKSWSDIELNESQIKNLNSLTETNLYKLKEVLPKELQILVDKHELNVLDMQKVVAEIQKVYADIENTEADTTLKEKQISTEIFKQGELAAQTDLEISQNKSVQQQIQLFIDTYEDVVNQVANESKLSNRQVKSFWINTLLHGTQSAGAAAGGVGLLLKAMPK